VCVCVCVELERIDIKVYIQNKTNVAIGGSYRNFLL